jgi:hypothetical protein
MCVCLLLGLGLLGLLLLLGSVLARLALLALAPRLLAAGAGLVLEQLGAGQLGLLNVDELHQHALVLEHVTLALLVQTTVQVAIDLVRLTVLAQEAAQDTHAAHPDDSGREAGLFE